MAQLPLNVFKTKTAVLQSTWTTGTTATVYSAPIGVTSIILMTQVANIDSSTHAVTFAHYRNLPILKNAQGQGYQAPNTVTPLVTGYQIPPNDAASMTTGKMIIEQLDSIYCYADTDNACVLTLSVLETANS